MRVLLPRKFLKGITAFLLFLIGTAALLGATLPSSFQQQIGLSPSGSIFADLFHTQTTNPFVTTAASMTTDQSDYQPGSTALISGSGFWANELVTLQVAHVDGTTGGEGHDPWTVLADGNGNFTTTWYVDPDDSVGSAFLLTATGASSGFKASTTFTDNIGVNLDQCQNIDLVHLGDPCGTDPANQHPNWSNGDVNGQNSQYREGDGLPYRSSFIKVPNGTWTIRVEYDFTKAGIYAVDRLTKYNLTQASDPCLNTNDVTCSVGSPSFSFTMPGEVASPGATQPALASGGNLDIAGTPLKLNDDADSRKMTVWVESPGTGSFVSTEANVTQTGSATGDSSRNFAFKINLSNCPAAGCDFMLGWTGHIASATDWGDGKGASSISGAPFHMRILGIDQADGTSGGNQDRSVQLSAIVSQTLEVRKVTDPTDDRGKFNLHIDDKTAGTGADVGNGGTTGTNFVTTGSHKVGETAGTGTSLSGYTSTITCVQTLLGVQTTLFSNQSGTSANVNVVDGAEVICTIKNQNIKATHGQIIVHKDIVPDDATKTFPFTVSGGNTPADFKSFSLGDNGTKDSNDSCTKAGLTAPCLDPGTYSVTETTDPSYDTKVSCQSNLSASIDPTAINLNGGEIVDCYFVNTLKPPDISITKAADKGTVNAGDTIGFTLTVKNNGPGTANSVVLTDTLPANSGLSWSIDAAGTTAPNCSISSGKLTCNIGTLANGASVKVHITSTTTGATCGTVNNTGKVTASNEPGDKLGDNEASASITVNCPVIEILKTADKGTVNAGDNIGFTITVKNSGTGDAAGVVLTDTLPTTPGTSWSIDAAGTTAPNCGIAAGVLTCNIGTLTAGSSVKVHITSPTTGASCGTVDNTGKADATNDAADPVTSKASITVNCPKIEISKTADKGTVNAGDNVGFTVTVSNTGTGDAAGVVLTDTLPTTPGTSWSIDAAGTTAPNCSITAGVLTCNIGNLAAGASVKVHLTSPTTGASCGTVDNTGKADATNDAADPVTSKASITVNCPKIEILKTADKTPVNAGDNIGFTVVVKNSGTGDATGVVLTDTLPTTAGTSWSIDAAGTTAPNCSITAGVLTCNIGGLAAGASVKVHLTSKTTAASCGKIDNTGKADAGNDAADPVTSSASISVLCSDVSVLKSADAASVGAPDSIGFVITVKSNGPAPAANVVLMDTLPTGLTWSIDAAGTTAPNCSITAGVLTCNIGAMAASTSVKVHIVSSATTADNCGTVKNTATVSADFEPDTSNNSASASEDVLCGKIVIIKNATPQSGTFSFTGTGTGYPDSYTLNGDPTGGLNVKSTSPLIAGKYTVTEGMQLGWTLTGIGGSTNPATPYNCVITGTNGSTGVGDLTTQQVIINLKGGDTVTCTFENTGTGATRTQGFWATHPQLAQIAWFGGSGFGHVFPGVPNLTIGPPAAPCRTIGTLADLMGGFWSGISKTSTGKKRSALDQSRVQLLQQLLAAELNYSAFGPAPAGGFATIQKWEDAYCGTDISAINAAQQGAGSFNSQGDSSTFTPGTSADSKTARAVANYVTWDKLP